MARLVPDRRRWEQLAEAAQYNAPKLARLCNVSIRQLERQFHLKFGCSPQKWLDERRIAAAKELLLSGHSVKETSSDLDFKQIPHFCRQFKSHAGLTPSQFAHFKARIRKMSPTDNK
jgi:AraC-like DNA-binding protein